jgi:hypothetical protein
MRIDTLNEVLGFRVFSHTKHSHRIDVLIPEGSGYKVSVEKVKGSTLTNMLKVMRGKRLYYCALLRVMPDGRGKTCTMLCPHEKWEEKSLVFSGDYISGNTASPITSGIKIFPYGTGRKVGIVGISVY